MPVNPFENLTAVACLRMEAAWKGRYGQFAGSVDTSQAKCKLGLSAHVNQWKHLLATVTAAGMQESMDIG